MKKKVILGLSGGVDSSVAAIRLLDMGYEVEGLFMRNWDASVNNDVLGNPTKNDDICPEERDYADALAVANKLGIKLHRIDFIEEYWDNVFTYFLDEYKKGRTPNPDVMCNKEIKFKAFLKEALRLNADYIAMGHYAQVEHKDGVTHLLRAVDTNKDQTYFLCLLSQQQLEKALFPIGDMIKPEVRRIASLYDLVTAQKKDSTGICFIGERRFHQFLKNYLPSKPGNMETIDGIKVGEHDGLMYYTIGQRKGLNIGGNNKFLNKPWFVVGKNLVKNVLIVSQDEHDPLLKSNRIIVKDYSFIAEKPEYGKMYQAKFRYRQADTNVMIRIIDDNTLEVTYDESYAVTPGQVCAMYDGQICIGGGIIDEVYYNDEIRAFYK